MSYEIINVGELPNDGTGDPVRVAFIKINNNFSLSQDTYDPRGVNGAIQFKQVVFDSNSNTFSNTFGASNNLSFNSTSNSLQVEGKITPLTNGNLDLGTSNNRIGNIYVNSSGMQIGNIKISSTGNTLNFSVAGSNVAPALSLGNMIVESDIFYGNTKLSSAIATTTTDGANLTILSIPLTQIKEGEFNIQSRRANSLGSQTATVKAHVNNTGTTATYVVYGTMFVGPALTNYNVGITSSNVELKVSPLVNDTIIHTINYSINK